MERAVQIATFISSQPDLNIPVPERASETWLLTTYLDDEVRISRGDMGSIFVLTRDTPATDTPDWSPPSEASTSAVESGVAEAVATGTEAVKEEVEKGAGVISDAAVVVDEAAGKVIDAAASQMVEDGDAESANKGKGKGKGKGKSK